jgi:hypothetical protein
LFNEHLGPLRRFLDSNVGRPWDKVYSEICRHVDRSNVVQKHILTHLFDYVVTNVVLIDGQPCRSEAYARLYGEPLRTSDRRNRWYVCPKSGRLRKSKYVPRTVKRPEPPRNVRLNKKQLCLYRNGRWELISVELLAQTSWPREAPAYDAVLQRYQEQRDHSRTDVSISHGGHIYGVNRRVLSRRELLALPIPIEWLK